MCGRSAGGAKSNYDETLHCFCRAQLPDRHRQSTRIATPAVCDDPIVSRRDLLHVLNALSRLSGDDPDVGVSVAAVDEAIGRGHGDMRTPLNLQSLAEDHRARQRPDGTWALTAEGLAWLAEDRELSDR